MRKAWLHLKLSQNTDTKILHCFKAGIPLQGLLHDLSKYSPAGVSCGREILSGNRSPNDVGEAYGYSTAWMHHKGETSITMNIGLITILARVLSPVKMPFKYLVEMFCDRVAASKIYMKDKYTDRSPLEYFLKAKGRRFIHPETSHEIENLLTMLAER